MKINLTLLFFIGLTVASFTVLNSQTEKFKLEGVWVAEKYKFSNISAMDDTTARQWIEKKAIIKEQLYFEYYKIQTYNDIFKDKNYCNFRVGQKREMVSPDKYFSDNYKMTPAKLGITQKEILVIHTNCNGTPFDEIVILKDNEIMICWDGVFFFLTREQ